MELLLGSHVREHGIRVGRLAGFELEPATLRIRRILFSPHGEMGSDLSGRPLADVALVHDDGEVELRSYGADSTAAGGVIQLSRATRMRRGGRYHGHLAGIETRDADRTLDSVFVRNHWWARRFTLPASGLDFSVPGEIRTGGSRAA